jgi:hypothetical protein
MKVVIHEKNSCAIIRSNETKKAISISLYVFSSFAMF